MSVMVLNPKQRTRAKRQPSHALRDSATQSGRLPIGCGFVLAFVLSGVAWLILAKIGGVL